MMNRPNVLVLYTDQQRWDTIHAGGNPLIRTPNLDRLAIRGARPGPENPWICISGIRLIRTSNSR